MKSLTTERFWRYYAVLPQQVKRQAREAYGIFAEDPYHPSLHFKRIHSTRPIFSVRITKDYRAVGIVEGNEITWFWVGTHADYDALIKRMRTT
jgi:hypothetical protein